MGLHRLYADEHGETHFGELEDWPSEAQPLLDGVPALEYRFVWQAPGSLVDWHPIPWRCLWVTLSGAAEVSVSDGETRVAGPGSVALVEDLTGRGHRTRILPGEPRHSLMVVLADQTPTGASAAT